MKLLTYDSESGTRCGVLRGDDVVDVAALLGIDQPLQDVRALLETGESAVDQVRTALASNSAAPSVPLASVRLRYSARTVPAQCPHGARTVPAYVFCETRRMQDRPRNLLSH